jgi:CRISPR/Cas system-associated exonuclease Cas4 (RecB family)
MLTLREQPEVPTLRSIDDLGPHVDLEKVLNLNAVYTLGIDNSNDEHSERMGHWHPSSVGYCKRSQVLQFIRTPPTDKQSKRIKEIFEFGHMVHDLVQKRLESLAPHMLKAGLNYEFQREVKFDPETDALFLDFGIGGTTDGILRVWGPYFEQRGIVEIKSQGDERHKELEKMGTAWPNHLMQSHLYAFRFDCPIIWVFYINKNNSKREVRLHLFDQEIFDAAIVYFDECGDFVRRGELPPREETYFECKECQYRTLCRPKILNGGSKLAMPDVPKVGLRRR